MLALNKMLERLCFNSFASVVSPKTSLEKNTPDFSRYRVYCEGLMYVIFSADLKISIRMYGERKMFFF